MRSALVDYFQDQGQIMIATEAGAGGHQPPVLLAGRELRPAVESAAHRAAHRSLPSLRAEARRGRRELPQPDRTRPTSASFACSREFKLFEGVFGASDEVLGAIESGVDFEKRIADIYQQCRSPKEIKTAFDQLQASWASRSTKR